MDTFAATMRVCNEGLCRAATCDSRDRRLGNKKLEKRASVVVGVRVAGRGRDRDVVGKL
jgi:hypothetical protein